MVAVLVALKEPLLLHRHGMRLLKLGLVFRHGAGQLITQVRALVCHAQQVCLRDTISAIAFVSSKYTDLELGHLCVERIDHVEVANRRLYEFLLDLFAALPDLNAVRME